MGRRSAEWVDRALESVLHEYEEKAHRGIMPAPIEHGPTMWFRLGPEEDPSSEVAVEKSGHEALQYWIQSIRSHWLKTSVAERSLERFARSIQERLRLAEVLHEPQKQTANPDSAIVELTHRVQELEERVARLEETSRIPFQPLEDDGDPLEILRTLRQELGADRFKWFSSSE